VIDPVMIAESGAILLDDDARRVCAEKLLPLAAVVTPNIPEARVLTRSDEEVSQPDLARAVVALGPRAAVVTGGHSEEVVDYFFDGGEVTPIRGPRHPAGASHGSGCTHSASLAALLALGHEPLAAAERAREITSEAVKNGLRDIGQGAGPVDVFGLAEARERG
jgi:hydroxymethylpyrimidine/phosphomethylpyrimidine kinase